MTSTYVPPRVWTWDQKNGGEFASINRPIAGPTHSAELPQGAHGFQLHSMATPNGVKVTVMFEELLEAGFAAEYDAWPVSILEGGQFSSGFIEVNPNSKIPALLDLTGAAPVRLFESGAMLLHLADKFGAFLPRDGAARTEVLNWLFWQMGSAPFLGGGFGHFFTYAPEKFQYPIDRFTMEVKRQLDVLNRQLALTPYIAGEAYSIADMAIWPWYGQLVLGRVYPGSAEFLEAASYSHLVAWAEKIDQRPAVKRGRIVNRLWGEENEQLPERHSAADFDGKDV